MPITANTRQWQIGVASLVPRCSAVAKARLRQQAEHALELADARVHVVTGRLRSSGRIEEFDGPGDDMRIEVIFGGEDYGVDYAAYEEAYHPFLEPSCAEAFGQYESAGGMELEGPFD